jgi:hypothetical protein
METRQTIEDAKQAEVLSSRNHLNNAIRSGAQWFYGIGVIYLLAAFYYLLKKTADYIVLVGIAELAYVALNGRANPSENNLATIRTVSFVTAILVGSFFLLTGLLAGRRNRRWFVLGCIVFVIDAAINLLVFDIPGIVFHMVGLWGIFSGLNAIDNLRKMESGDAAILQMYGNKAAIEQRAKIKYSTAVWVAIVVGVVMVAPFLFLYILLKLLAH